MRDLDLYELDATNGGISSHQLHQQLGLATPDPAANHIFDPAITPHVGAGLYDNLHPAGAPAPGLAPQYTPPPGAQLAQPGVPQYAQPGALPQQSYAYAPPGYTYAPQGYAYAPQGYAYAPQGYAYAPPPPGYAYVPQGYGYGAQPAFYAPPGLGPIVTLPPSPATGTATAPVGAAAADTAAAPVGAPAPVAPVLPAIPGVDPAALQGVLNDPATLAQLEAQLGPYLGRLQ